MYQENYIVDDVIDADADVVDAVIANYQEVVDQKKEIMKILNKENANEEYASDQGACGRYNKSSLHINKQQ